MSALLMSRVADARLHDGAQGGVVGQAGERRALDQLVQVLVDAQAVLRRDGVQVGIGLFPEARHAIVQAAVETLRQALTRGDGAQHDRGHPAEVGERLVPVCLVPRSTWAMAERPTWSNTSISMPISTP